jgi:hypothetical protein
VRVSKTHFEPDLPYWQDYLPFLQNLTGRDFPTCNQLNALLPDGLSSENGQIIRFVPSTELDDGAYEHRIYTTGQVSTRPDHWHDLFNALVWMRFPHIKIAMNTLHFHAYAQQTEGSRGSLRDALTLFDECGVIVFSQRPELLEALAQRRWSDVFQEELFEKDIQLAICGHAMLEKYLSPYKSMTAKALLVKVDTESMTLSRDELLTYLDQQLAEQLLAANIMATPACLTPLPLAGVPGWWPDAEQDNEFYADQQVFRPPPAQLKPAPFFNLY